MKLKHDNNKINLTNKLLNKHWSSEYENNNPKKTVQQYFNEYVK